MRTGRGLRSLGVVVTMVLGGTAGLRADAAPLTGAGHRNVQSGCTESAAALCLRDGRFETRVDWHSPYEGGSIGVGTAVQLSDETGYFWFFDRSNVEVVVKILDGRAQNGRFWVYFGALSDVEYTVTITDTVTGAVTTYRNPAHHLGSFADTAAFGDGAPRTRRAAMTDLPGTAAVWPAAGRLPAAGAVRAALPPRVAHAGATACATSGATLCLAESGLQVEVAWSNPYDGSSGVGSPVQLTPDSGYFTFFDAGYVELVVKVLDGRSLNGRFWFIYGALSDVEYTITVTDPLTLAVKTYHNPPKTLSSIIDVETFQPPVRVTLLALNDLHGNLLPPTGSAGRVRVANPADPAGTLVSAGGLAYLATLVKQVERENPNTLLVGAGDLVGRSPLTSGLIHDEPTVAALNLLGLDVSAVGSSELDHGTVELLRLAAGGCFPLSSDGLRGIVGFDTCMTAGAFAGADYHYLTANVTDSDTGNPLFPPAELIRHVAGHKIGFIGLTTPAAPTEVAPGNTEGLEFGDEIVAARGLAEMLRRRGAEVIVVLVSEGGMTTASVVNDHSCPELSGEIVALADGLGSLVDVVVSGRTHQEYVCQRPDGKLVTQAGDRGRLLTRVDLFFDRSSGRLVAKQADNLVVVNDLGVRDSQGNVIPLPAGVAALAKDVEMEALIQSTVEATAPIASQVIGSQPGPLTRTTNAAGESQVGDVVADIYLDATSGVTYGSGAAEIAFANAGGIRSDLPSAQITYGQLFTVMPFGNTLVTLSLTGEQILRLLEQQWEAPQPAAGRVMQVSAGFSYTWDASQPGGAPAGTGQRVVAGSLRLHGEPIDLTRTYRVTVNNFMAAGGDNFTVLLVGTEVQGGDVDITAGFEYVRRRSPVPTPGQNRISRLN